MCKENQNILVLSQRITFRLHKPLVDHIIQISLGKTTFLCFSLKFAIARFRIWWFAQPGVLYLARQKGFFNQIFIIPFYFHIQFVV